MMGIGLGVTVTGELWAAFLCLMAFLVMVLYRNNTNKDICVSRMLFICMLIMVSDTLTRILDGCPGETVKSLLYAANYVLYASSYLIVVMFIQYMWQMAKRGDEPVPFLFHIFGIGAIASIAALTVGVFFDLYFYIDDLNVYHRTDLYIISQLITVFGVAALVWSTVKYRKRLSKFEIIAAFSYFLLPTAGTLVQSVHYGVACQQFGFAAATLITFFVREANVRGELIEITRQEQENKLELEAAKEAAEKRGDELNEQLDIIGSLAATYASIYYVDMSSMTFNELGKSGDYVEKIIGTEGDALAAMERMCQYIVASDQADDMRVFTDLTTLDERMKDHFWISRQFHAGSGRWDEGVFIATKRDDSGHCLNVIWAIRDINERKLREIAYQQELEKARDRADAANAAKTAFLFNMSHDIRTPMNAIIGYTDLIEKHYDDKERCMDYLHKTQQSNRFLLSLINDVLEMARIESGKAELEEVVSPVGSIAREISAIFEDQMKAKKITYLSHINTHTEWAFYDQAKVREIYLNILSNALKYTPEGGTVSLEVEEITWNKPGYIGIRAVFSDTGIGMSEEFLPHLFESFTRERTATESRQQGTGLGMPIVKKIIDLMGGTIEVQSELGKGSVFTVTYPLKTEGAEPRKTEEKPVAGTVDFTGRRLLLAEDNDLNAEIASEILKEAGFLTERAEDGRICVDRLIEAEAGYFDAVLMDIQMPNMNGYEAAGEIRALADKTKAAIPIIAMTANAFESDRQDALKAGMNGHIAKPIEIPKLMETLAEILK